MMKADRFIGDLVLCWREHECLDIDGAEFQDLLLRHGLARLGMATPEQADDMGIDAGDEILLYNSTILKLIGYAEGRRRREIEARTAATAARLERSTADPDKDPPSSC